MNYLADLNEAQRKAVEHMKGPSIVLAGAGSGKTRVLSYRIAHLMNNGVDSFNILALTFTNKASREMKARIASIVGDTEAQNLWMGTFHSIFARILRYESEKIGYPSNFSIYDTLDSRSLIKSIVKEYSLDDKIYKPNLIQHRISSAKNSMIMPKQYNEDSFLMGEDAQSGKPKLGEIYSTYKQRLFKAGAMDFDDLLVKTYHLLNENGDVLLKYQNKFQYVLVDEFQDTNEAQYLILKKLAARFENICVVGDDAQSIYAFRGANIENILNFQKDYTDTTVFKLEQNYRSSQNIVNAANSVINKNKSRLHKEVWTENVEGSKIKVLRTLTDNEEGRAIANQIFELKNNYQQPNIAFAVLYRTNAQSRAIEEALRKSNIPYRVYGGLSFYQRKEVKDLLAYFRLAINHNDEEALKRVINYPTRGIGQTTMERIAVTANEASASLWEVLSDPIQYPVKINAGTSTRIGDFVTMIKSFTTGLEKQSAYDLGSSIASSSGLLKDLFSDQTPEGLSRYDNIQELLNGMKEFSDQETDDGHIPVLGEFLQDVALLTDQDQDDDENKDRVSLMTIHAAKGLEFPYVFVSGMEENLFPSQLSLHDRADLEEERRLFYVALTRAMKRVTLTYATSRYRWGNLIHCEPSRFLEEIDEQYLDFPQLAMNRIQEQVVTKRKKVIEASVKKPLSNRKLVNIREATGKIIDFQSDDTINLQVGMQVEHQRFGKGKVINIDGGYPNQKATVHFPDSGQKQLLLKFAKLKILN